MNVIYIMLDSLRQDHVSFYNQGKPVFDGIPACRTPNIDAFAKDCIVFRNAYPEGLPTLPVRTEILTGQRTLPFHGWQPLLREHITITEILREQGYTRALISDTYHYRAPGQNYHRGFHSYIWIRGQEYDPYRSAKSRRNIDDYVNEHFDERWRARISQFLQNTDEFTNPDDWFSAQVVEQACKWLKENRDKEKIFLFIDSFDPHEPWDPPEQFDTYTDKNYRGPRLIMPMGGMASDWATPEQIRLIQGLYAGEVSMVDHHFGRLFKTLAELGYYEDSIIVLLADHGHPLADHGKFLKGADRLYGELLKVPFMIRLPGGKGARTTDAIVQFQDLPATVLDLLGLGNCTDAMHGKPFTPVLKGDADDHREAVIVGYHEGIDRAIRDKNFSYIERPGDEPDELYDLNADPRERKNIIDQHPEEARRLAAMFGPVFRRARRTAIKGVQGRYEMTSAAVD